jgi:uncharacterized protein YndB with AHSA1/START domain
VVHCEVLAVDPPRRLSYSWRGGSEQISRLDTIVTWTLTPTATGTRLGLEHAGFVPANAFAFEALGKGWRGKVQESLRDLLAQLG